MYFDKSEKIANILDKYPETLEVFTSNGFEQLNNPIMRKTMASSVTLEAALKVKKINEELFYKKLIEVIEEKGKVVDKTLNEEGSFSNGDLNIEGVLPCPIRIPLLENFSAEVEKVQKDMDKKIGYDLRSASMGIDWLKEQIETGDDKSIPDIMLSAGFEFFFDKKYMGKFNDRGVFQIKNENFNSDFCNEKINLKDPKDEYYILGVVPAIFMVNENMLGDRPMPKSWADILKPEFENCVALPMHDLDLFNAVMLHIYKMFGDEGLKNLGRSFYKSLHPAQMVKSQSNNAQGGVVVNISPYFFTQMIPQSGAMKVVWPEDGAIISPIFLIAKKDREDLTPFVDYFMSKKVGDIFSQGGKFPSTNALVDNRLSDKQTFQWVGWDYIHNNDIGEILKHCEIIFNEVALGQEV